MIVNGALDFSVAKGFESLLDRMMERRPNLSRDILRKSVIVMGQFCPAGTVGRDSVEP